MRGVDLVNAESSLQSLYGLAHVGVLEVYGCFDAQMVNLLGYGLDLMKSSIGKDVPVGLRVRHEVIIHDQEVVSGCTLCAFDGCRGPSDDPIFPNHRLQRHPQPRDERIRMEIGILNR